MEMVLHQPRGSGGGARASTAACRQDPAVQPTATMKKEEEEEDGGELRRGPWTVDEDLILINYIAEHGEGRWNALARAAGTCVETEQKKKNDDDARRWSKIAQQLPGRTDNEIKNYWRTRVQKHARQLGCDVGSRRFKDAMTYLWMPRLAQRASAANSSPPPQPGQGHHQQQHHQQVTTTNPTCLASENNNNYYHSPGVVVPSSSESESSSLTSSTEEEKNCWTMQGVDDHDEFWSTAVQDLTMVNPHHQFQQQEDDLITGWVQGFSEDISDQLWSLDDIWRMH
ncbi:hypothetical protein PR202_gb13730 [Eleusine coracana subsp. coracana]|uniref:Uncharacterized protein n=1 Tax=Eleusine coracana subsp. coracana TaxID=191504 RepID=A0AAV5EUU7_ELECO|nr:hypothetical protein PR202_gb13730 [Eleusine coracana subsp. coracana]